jgi:uncharacterized protein (DUF433 family)/DNA-binding transcriptional MerR regulator
MTAVVGRGASHLHEPGVQIDILVSPGVTCGVTDKVRALRGVYTAERASALAGVPRSTLYYWARNELIVPSVSPTKIKLWSWADLLALRAIYWLRHPAQSRSDSGSMLPQVPAYWIGEGLDPAERERSATTWKQVRQLIEIIEQEAGRLGEAIAEEAFVLTVDPRGTPHIEVNGRTVEASHSWKQLVGRELVVDLLSVFSAQSGVAGPNLRQPREHLRIVPGKLSGEPHVLDTRIETCVIASLHRRGFSEVELLGLYGDLSPDSISEALSLEDQLDQNLRAA